MELTVQRLHRRVWQPSGALRSWGLKSVVVGELQIYVPTLDEEVIWLGVSLDSEDDAATVILTEAGSGYRGRIQCPPDYQLAVIEDERCAWPIERRDKADRADFDLSVHARCGTASFQTNFHLQLMEPGAWCRLTGQPSPSPLAEPPPPPRLF